MTTARYITVMYDRLDKIVNKRYGDTDRGIVEFVLNNNPGIENYGLILPAGLAVMLPDRPQEQKSVPVIKLIRLFD